MSEFYELQKLIYNGLMTVGNEKLKIKDVCDLLSTRYAFISGAKAFQGAYPILTFPDVKYNASFCDYKRIITYMLDVPPLEDSYQGYVIVIDRRQDKWTAVKNLLLNISDYFPAPIHVICLLKPESVFQKALELGYRAGIEATNLKIVVCQSVFELHWQLDKKNLTPDLGGTYHHHHLEWVQQRMDIERMKTSTQVISMSLSEFDQTLRDTELPNDVDTTSRLLEFQKCEQEAIKEDFRIVVRKGLGLLQTVRQCDSKPSPGQLSPNRLHNVISIERLLVQLEETEKNFDTIWQEHENKLQQCLRLRLFENSFKALQATFAMHMVTLEENREVGDSVENAEELLFEHQRYMESAMVDVRKADELKLEGDKLILQKHYAVDHSIKPKCQELKRLVEAFCSAGQRRTEVLKLSKKLHQQISAANSWCSQGVRLLSSQPVELNSKQDLSSSMQELEDFLGTVGEVNLDCVQQMQNPDLRNIILLATTDNSALLQQVVARIGDVKTMCEKRVAQLQKLAVKDRMKPIVAVSPEKKRSPTQSSAPEASAVSVTAPAASSLESFSRESPFRRSRADRASPKKTIEVMHSYSTSMENSDRNGLSSRKLSLNLPLNSCAAENGVCVTNEDCLTTPSCSSGLNSVQTRSAMVIQELLTTEEAYVKELETIVNCYVNQFRNTSNLFHLIPEALQGNDDIVFGNLVDICQFHKTTFLKDLTAASFNASKIARCFLEHRDFLFLYNLYCQNKPRSEALRQQVGENNTFFQECQKLAGHRLPLGAFLLKPVQRITKYQLILKELSKSTSNQDTKNEVDQALNAVLDLLVSVNASMYENHIVGYPGNLCSLGYLLLHAKFSVWPVKKQCEKGLRIRRTSRAQNRHIFLYEKAVLFTKEKTQPPPGSREYYEYKSKLSISGLHLSPTVKGNDYKFELWTDGRAEVYVLQAANAKTKDEWVVKIGSLLSESKTGGSGRSERPVSWVSLTSNDSSSTSRSSREFSTPELNTKPSLNVSSDDSNNNPSTPQHSISSGTDAETVETSSIGALSDVDNNIVITSSSSAHPCKALFDYLPVSVEELQLSAGEQLTILCCDNDWALVQRAAALNEKGWVPRTHIQRLTTC